MVMTQVLTAAVGLCLLLGANAQGPQLGLCDTYQTSPNFNQAFVEKMQNEDEGYSFLLSSGPTYGCRKLRFFSNGTYVYRYTAVNGEGQINKGSYTTRPYSFSRSATITLNHLPSGELGAVFSSVTLNVLKANDDQLVLLSCNEFGLIRSQAVHVLIPDVKSASISDVDVESALAEEEVPLIEYAISVPQTCLPNTRQTVTQLFQLYRFLAKIGLVPTLPFRRPTTSPSSGSSTGSTSSTSAATFYSALNSPATRENLNDILRQNAPLFHGLAATQDPSLLSMVVPQILASQTSPKVASDPVAVYPQVQAYSVPVPVIPPQQVSYVSAPQYQATGAVQSGNIGSGIYTAFYPH